jgi:hypothetical protein
VRDANEHRVKNWFHHASLRDVLKWLVPHGGGRSGSMPLMPTNPSRMGAPRRHCVSATLRLLLRWRRCRYTATLVWISMLDLHSYTNCTSMPFLHTM